MLADLRKTQDVTQEQLAQALNLSQRGVSHIEHEPNPRLQTLSNFVKVLGGRLELRAVFEDGHSVEIELPARDAPPEPVPHT